MRSFHSFVFLFVVVASPVVAQQDSEPAATPKAKSSQEVTKAQSEASSKVDGSWRLEYEWNGAQVVDIYRLKSRKGGKLVGVMKRTDTEEMKIQDGKIDGDKIRFTVKGDYEGSAYTVTYQGKVGTDNIDGEVAIVSGDQTWDFPWKPTRTFTIDDMVGVWMIRIENPNGEPFEPQLHVAKKGGSPVLKYIGSQGDEIAAKNFNLEGKQLSFEIATEINGNAIRLGYSGAVEGDSLKGELSYDLAGNTGETTFTAKRKPAAKSKKTSTKKPDGKQAGEKQADAKE